MRYVWQAVSESLKVLPELLYVWKEHCQHCPLEGPACQSLLVCTHCLHPVYATHASYTPRLLRVRAGCQAVLVGSSSLALWDVARQKRTAKLTGHTVRPAMPGSPADPARSLTVSSLGTALHSVLHVAFNNVAFKPAKTLQTLKHCPACAADAGAGAGVQPGRAVGAVPKPHPHLSNPALFAPHTPVQALAFSPGGRWALCPNHIPISETLPCVRRRRRCRRWHSARAGGGRCRRRAASGMLPSGRRQARRAARRAARRRRGRRPRPRACSPWRSRPCRWRPRRLQRMARRTPASRCSSFLSKALVAILARQLCPPSS